VTPLPGVKWNWWRKGMMGSAKANYDGVVAFSQIDFHEDWTKLTVPVLVMLGDDDQLVSYSDSAPLSAWLLPNGILKTYPGLFAQHADNQSRDDQRDLLAFIQS